MMFVFGCDLKYVGEGGMQVDGCVMGGIEFLVKGMFCDSGGMFKDFVIGCYKCFVVYLGWVCIVLMWVMFCLMFCNVDLVWGLDVFKVLDIVDELYEVFDFVGLFDEVIVQVDVYYFGCICMVFFIEYVKGVFKVSEEILSGYLIWCCCELYVVGFKCIGDD